MSTSSFDRRQFLARGLAAAGIHSLLSTESGNAQTPSASNVIPIADDGWRLWLDQAAEWKSDAIYLPEDVNLATLPVNTPTGGWDILNSAAGIPVALPATVEQFYWGVSGLRPYKDEYKFETDDPAVKNGAYYGVSWWWRDLEIPAGFRGKRILLHVRAARQRAEVYLNRELVGYSILEELPFECDLTDAANPGGDNRLAIRITNPGGRLDWVDKNTITWGKVTFQRSHGFGGLDRRLTLSAHGPARISDSWVLNTSDPRTITAHAEIRNDSPSTQAGGVRFSIVDSATQSVLASQEVQASVDSGSTAAVSARFTYPAARLWDLDSPNLYTLRVIWLPASDVRDVDFGFRWFAPEGIGANALFRLNGRRTRIYTAISWGYWGLNGIFPTPELARKEVDMARQFNLNCLNFHRNLAKEEVLIQQDRIGLLRCIEPGGGILAVAQAGREHDFGVRYMQAKVLGMIRAFRSHPSVVEYILQNEASPDLKNSNLERFVRRMQALDPSRSIVVNDGFASRSSQAWFEPYSDRFRTSAEGGAGGWWDEHTASASDVWRDAYYVSVNDYAFRSTNRAEIVEWGEMKGAAAIDDHQQLIAQIRKHGGKSYDLADHQELLAVYEKFLDRHGFRAAFPRASDLFQSIGRRAYESWAQYMENIRICDAVDYATISGWESTAMENHSGIVDNFRDFKSDPKVLADSLLPIRPVAKQKQIAVALGGRAQFDLYLLNDTGRPVTGQLTFTIADPNGKVTRIAGFDAPKHTPDQFSYLIAESVETAPLESEGVWRASLALSTPALSRTPVAAHHCDIYVVNGKPAPPKPIRVGVSGLTKSIASQLANLPGLTIEPFTPGKRCDVIVASAPAAAETAAVTTDDVGADKRSGALAESALAPEVLAAFQSGTPLFVVCTNDGQAAGVGRQLAAAGILKFEGMVGASRASWMGTWYFVRRHPIYAGLPTDRAMSIEYQVRGSDSNGFLVDAPGIEVIAAYSRDHERRIGAGTFALKTANSRLVVHRITGMHPVFHQRLLANAIHYLA
jgi:hypothetical protein